MPLDGVLRQPGFSSSPHGIHEGCFLFAVMPNDPQPLLASAYWDYSRKAVVSQTVTAPFLMSEQEQLRIADMTACYQAVPWLFRCVQLRADAVSKMPFRITKKGSKAKEPVDSSADYQNHVGFLPNPVNLLWRTEAAASIWGTGYWWRSYNSVRTLGLRYLLPTTITPEIDDEEGLVGFTRYVSGQPRPVTTADLVYFWRPDPFVEIGPPTSSPVKAALAAANVLLNVDLFAAAFFQRGAIKATLLTVEGNPPKSEKEALKAWWERMLSGIRNAFSTEVVSASVKPVQIGEGIGDLANITLTDEKKADIAVAMSVPRSVLDSSTATGLGGGGVARQDDKHFYDKGVLPECEWLQADMNEQVFHPQGLHWEFTPELLEIYQADEAGLAQSFKLYVDIGLPKSLAAQMVGIELPSGWEYEDLDKLEKPQEIKPPASPDRPQLEAPNEEDDAEDNEATPEGKAIDTASAAPAPVSAPTLTPFEQDIRAWRSKSKRKGKVAPFVSEAIPEQIADAVKFLGQNDWRRGFAWLAELQALKAKREPDREAEAALRDEITALLLDWRRRFAEAIVNGDEVAYDELSNELRLLIGPYLVLAVLDSYMAQAALMGVAYDITLVNIAALQWANQYSYELIKNINATTQKLVSEAIAQFVRTPGMTIGDIERMLEQSFGEVRAEMIAITETTRAYSQGTRVLQDLLRQSGVDMVRVWKTGADEVVCDICRPLEGKTEDEWPDDLKDGPPAHVKCRCGTTLRLRKPTKSVVDWTWPFSMSRWATDDDLAALGVMVKGGPGSGNWGHAGRPGKRGGSQPGGGLAYIGVDRGSSRADRVRASLTTREKRKRQGAEKEPLKPWQMTGEQVRAELSKLDTAQYDDVINQLQSQIDANNQVIRDYNEGRVNRTDLEVIQRTNDAFAQNRSLLADKEQAILARGALGRHLIYAEEPGTIGLRVEAKTKAIVNNGKIAMDEFNRMVGDKEFSKEVVLVANRSSRAKASGNGIFLGSKDGVRTHIHEIGHVYEAFKPGVREKAFAFVDSRTAGEKSVSLRRYTGANYNNGEFAKPDRFIDPYVGKTYGRRATEVISMGFEHMWADPAKFARGDPGHFDLIWNIMRGN